MGILTVRLRSEDEKKLEQVLAVSHIDKSTLVRNLITDQWLSLKAGQSFVQRRGGHPPASVLKSGSTNLSDRAVRKGAISAYVKNKAARRGRGG